MSGSTLRGPTCSPGRPPTRWPARSIGAPSCSRACRTTSCGNGRAAGSSSSSAWPLAAPTGPSCPTCAPPWTQGAGPTSRSSASCFWRRTPVPSACPISRNAIAGARACPAERGKRQCSCHACPAGAACGRDGLHPVRGDDPPIASADAGQRSVSARGRMIARVRDDLRLRRASLPFGDAPAGGARDRLGNDARPRFAPAVWLPACLIPAPGDIVQEFFPIPGRASA
eukprot:15452876-Alexandrium_andersonii.AAC.1